MTPDQWRRARDLFEEALDTPLGDVDSWLARQTADAAVLHEVRSLLTHHTQAGAFLDTPAFTGVGDLLSEDARFEAGQSIGPYLITTEIGRGGMGRVYLAADSRLGRQVALKVLAPSFVRDAGQRERLRREARAAALLSHPGICTVYALEEIGSEVVIASEYVEGPTLREVIDSQQRPTVDEWLRIARELSEALAAAHARRITHRDLKPENVIRAAGGSVKILDFGLAIVGEGPDTASASPRVTTPGTLVGTPAYMAPEQLEGGAVDARTDLFALGVLLYEYGSAMHPFGSHSVLGLAARILGSEPQPISSLRSDVPPKLQAVIERCLHKAPAARFQSAADVVVALATAADPATRSGAVSWWHTHLMAVLVLYAVAVSSAWLVKEWSHGLAEAGFVLVTTLAIAGGLLRGHLLFAERTHSRKTFLRELWRATPQLIAIDVVISVGLIAEGLWAAQTHSVPGVLIVGLGVGIALTRLVLERTTTEVAFGTRDTTV
jgi:hypothetical protein